MPHPAPNPHQLAALRLYGALMDQREDWGGTLVLACGPLAATSGIPVAVSIAGGTTLTVDSDASAMKSAMRSGELDFLVNTLDEALRTLKNEIRQRRPLSVGLIADFASASREMGERGLQPDLLLIAENQSAQAILDNPDVGRLQARGMRVEDRTNPREASNRREVYRSAADAAELRAIDERLLAIFPPGDLIRRRWIQQLPRYLREARTGGRWTWLTAEEESQLNA